MAAESVMDEFERCPVPRVASETSALLPPLHHNAGARHRTPAGGSGDAASPFALLVDAADAPPPKEPASRTPASSKASPRTTDQSPPTSASPDQSNDGACDAAPNASANTESQAADSSESDATDVERPDDTASADLLDALMAGTAGDGNVPQPVPPAAIVTVSVDVALAAQGALDGESTTAAGTAAAPVDPAAQLAKSDTPNDQATAENQAATSEQTASAQVAGADKVALAVDGDGTAQPDQQPTATQPSNDPAPAETGKSALEQAASKPPAPAQPQPTDTPPDAPVLASGKHPTPPTNSSSTEARKNDAATGRSEAATDAEDDGGKPNTTLAEPTPADRPVRGPHRANTDAPTVDDKERQPLGAEIRDAAHSAKPPAEAVHAVLLANDRAAAAAVAQTGSASGNQNLEPAVPIAGLVVEIVARAQAGQSRFEIRLDPPELGRIDVRLDIDRSGQVASRLIVDRPETLDQLRRDAAGLERALQDAGLKTAQNGLQFSLRDQGFAGRDYNSSSDAARLVVPDPDLAPVEIPTNAYARMVRTGGIDIRV
jgi:flagellar hook-length control protein FliK